MTQNDLPKTKHLLFLLLFVTCGFFVTCRRRISYSASPFLFLFLRLMYMEHTSMKMENGGKGHHKKMAGIIIDISGDW
jgi:hypothetical protein